MDPLSAALAEIENESSPDDDKIKIETAKPVEKKKKEARTRLPVKQPEKNNANLWGFLKQCIGKELSKITMPVQWNEPISLLQRVAEYMNYAYLLKKAAAAKTSQDRLELVATFAVSALASNFERMGKPFNPLLGESFFKKEL